MILLSFPSGIFSILVYSHSFRSIAQHMVYELVDFNICVFAYVHSNWADDVGVMKCAFLLILFSLSSCSLGAFLFGGRMHNR